MNDRFKFRCYSPTQETFAEVEKIDFEKGIVFDVCGEGYKLNEIILMQCTGLKDKNGTPIYEGDIVKSDFDFFTNTINPLRFKTGNVIYSDYRAGFAIASDINDYSPYKTSFLGKTAALNCEVIGNIYENKELLEGLNE